MFSLDPKVPANYHPISNLPFRSKVLEKVVSAQLHNYLITHSLNEKFQSGFRSGHSTESVPVRVTNDLLMMADAGFPSLLILLDLTAAFDTVDHHILCHRLHSSIGLSELLWPGLHHISRTEQSMYHWVVLNRTHTLLPVVSLKDQSLAPSSSCCTCSALVVSLARMEYLSIATLMTPNFTSKQTQPPLQTFLHFPLAWRR